MTRPAIGPRYLVSGRSSRAWSISYLNDRRPSLTCPLRSGAKAGYTHTNGEVGELNLAARGRLRQHSELGEDVAISTERGERQLATGNRIMFLRNERSLGVKNGTLGQVQSVSRRGLFVYDWTDVHVSERHASGAYELVASPSIELLERDLPANLFQMATKLSQADSIGRRQLRII